jgi:hypothetical protein
VRLRSRLLNIATCLGLAFGVIAFWAAPPSLAAAPSSDVPAWLTAHIGDGDGQIAQLVLSRARALYRQKIDDGTIRNACYFAMDATRPNNASDGTPGRRFYVICEADRSFRAISAGHGAGRDLAGILDFSNDRDCAKNFGNALGSELTAGGAYVTAETVPSFKGYYRLSAGRDAVLIRSFVQFDGKGETANARQRAIGGHAAVTLRGVCLQKNPQSPYANRDGYVPLGTLVDYAGGRSDGCTSWSPEDVPQILQLVTHDPTTLYIYPGAADVDAVARAVAAGQSPSRLGLYWNASCLSEIGAPKFWPKQTLEPILAEYAKDHPAPPRPPVPICQEP